jgi:hypothetical protein
MAQEVEVGDGRPFALRLVEEIRADARELVDAPLLSLSVREKVEAMEQIAAAQRALEAAHLAVVRSLRGQPLAEAGATTLPALVSTRLRAPLGKGRADVAAAEAACPDTGALPQMGAALADGLISRHHLDVAVATLDKIPTGVRRKVAQVLDETLLGFSRTYRPREVDHLAREILDRLDPDRHDRGFDPDAFARRGFTLATDAYGMGLPSGQLDPLTNASLKAAIDHFAAPTPAQDDRLGNAPFRDERTPAQRRCDALAEIARRALATAGSGGEDATRGGEPPRVVVHATVEDLTDRTSRGTVDCEQTGPVPRGAFAKMLCDCVLERVLLAPNGAVLNLGRLVRTATSGQKRALAGRD